MNFKEFKNAYCSGDEDKALQTLASEAVNDASGIAKSKYNLRPVIDSLDDALSDKYMEYYYAVLEEKINIQKYGKNDGILTISAVEGELAHSNYSTKGMKIVLPVFIIIWVALWIAMSWNQGVFAIVTTGLFMSPMIILAIIGAVLSTKVTRSIKNRDFYITTDTIADKKYKPGNAEDCPTYSLIFEKYGKFHLSGEGDFQSVKKGDEYYLLMCGKSKKPKFIYAANKWKISTDDFVFDGTAYQPVALRQTETPVL